ncbi:outer membrane protein [Legionella micdadei]|uniref:Outer membrane immunogenic protein n=1 Tax=Legionella micdadei TaxID=451 RepID=A0A098GBJ4_LEGMI|nr:outer membrane beta-barrel protein [Legionella micdadei]ARG98444.1 hypothetical protein B6N58_12690 [Legionella micdadei]KTD30345.1 hypothetical protein Lmic_0096 [Legionella micdadei]CEG59868.1 conserved exported protein of unknown function [Legionella micdadei]SCY52405.1 outer membrane immunogenic protein [Legionella micdadei]
MLRMTPSVGALSLLIATPCFSGFYVGAAVGPEGASFSQKVHVQRPGTFDAFNVIDRNHYAGIGLFGTLFAGLSWIYKQIYLAAEVNGTMSSVEYKLTNDEYVHQNFAKTSFTVRNSEGVSALPGFLLSENTVFYGRIGYANGRIKLVEGGDPTIHGAATRKNGLRWGLGIRHAFNEHFSFMMDFSQITYNSIHSIVFESNGNVTKATKITPKTAQVAFGLIYRFDRPGKMYVK